MFMVSKQMAPWTVTETIVFFNGLIGEAPVQTEKMFEYIMLKHNPWFFWEKNERQPLQLALDMWAINNWHHSPIAAVKT